MKKLASLVILLGMSIARISLAVEYGDLYGVDWCPCNPDERYDDKGSVVLGKTVMCPCDSMYDGYGASMEKDVRKIQQKTKHAVERASNYKYYVGVDYNKSQLNFSGKSINFDDLTIINVGGVSIPSSELIDEQDNIGIVFGVRPHRNLGIEAFYNRSYNKNTITRLDQGIVGAKDYHMVETFVSQYQAFGVDLLGYLPVTEYFDFIAFVGVGQYFFDNEASFEARYLDDNTVDSFSQDFDENKLAWRIGGGIQFNIARGVILRSMYRFIKLKTETIDYLQEFSVGIRFLF